MIRTMRTDAEHPDFIALVKQLDADLAVRDGNEHLFYSQFNKTHQIKHVVILYEDNIAAACGAIRELNPTSMEVKRMYTLPESRGKGLATHILTELESWARELGFKKCILETGKRQPEAIELYKKNGYHIIPNFGQYVGVENSVCFEKLL